MSDLNDLNRRIAEARGYKPVERKDGQTTDYIHGGVLYTSDPASLDYYTYPMPDWSTDANAALELLREMNDNSPMIWSISYENSMWCVESNPPLNTDDWIMFSIERDTPAEAICLAYLAWHEAQDT